MSKRKVGQVNVPKIEEDPAERKRILNVLAQRRYRRRRKEHVQHLEASAVRATHATDARSAGEVAVLDSYGGSFAFEESAFAQLDNQVCINQTPTSEDFGLRYENQPPCSGLDEPLYLDPSTLAAYDLSIEFPLPSLPSSPSTSNSTSLTTRPSASPPPQHSQVNDLPTPLSRDELHFPHLELNLLRGTMSIAKRMNIDELVWSLDALSPFHNLGSPPSSYTHLPSNLRPTKIQLSLPHHPIFDILPWPSVRDRLILVFSQPPEIRPPSARTPTALMDLVFDMDDSAEGMRIWGDDPYSEGNWEVGERVFSNWWWALDKAVIGRANELRKGRGARLLGSPAGRVDEVD